MQKINPKNYGFKTRALVWGLIALTGLVGLVSSGGCSQPTDEERVQHRLRVYQRVVELKGKLVLCGKTDSDPKNQQYLDEMCEQGVIEYQSKPYHAQGTQIYSNQQAAQRTSKQPTTNQNNNGNSPIDRATGNMVGDLATQGWINFFNDMRR